MNELPPQLRHQLEQLQEAQRQVEAIAAQRIQVQTLLSEVERALEELAKVSPETKMYKSVGRLLISYDKEKLEKELQEEKETLELRLKVLTRNEERLVERIQEMREKLEEMSRRK